MQLNLASQSVLEGLNACLDHRGEVYISELGRSFTVQHEKTRLFACQNPLNEGGGRKGLPKSFLNRFTKVRNILQTKQYFDVLCYNQNLSNIVIIRIGLSSIVFVKYCGKMALFCCASPVFVLFVDILCDVVQFCNVGCSRCTWSLRVTRTFSLSSARSTRRYHVTLCSTCSPTTKW